MIRKILTSSGLIYGAARSAGQHLIHSATGAPKRKTCRNNNTHGGGSEIVWKRVAN